MTASKIHPPQMCSSFGEGRVGLGVGLGVGPGIRFIRFLKTNHPHICAFLPKFFRKSPTCGGNGIRLVRFFLQKRILSRLSHGLCGAYDQAFRPFHHPTTQPDKRQYTQGKIL